MPPNPLPIDLAYLLLAFTLDSALGQHYLNRETGQILLVAPADRQQYDYFLETVANPTPEAIEAAISAEDLPFLAKESLRDIAAITLSQAQADNVFVQVPNHNPVYDIQDMSAFLDDVTDITMQEQLEACFAGGGALTRYRAILGKDRRLTAQWERFRQARHNQRLQRWLASEGLAAQS
jgi:hypothetical protein